MTKTTQTNPTGTGVDGAVDELARTTALVDRALGAYCDPDVARRQAAIADVWAADGELLDPPLEGRGHAALSGLADALLTHFPAHAFRRTSAVDLHHGHATYSWELVAPSGDVALAGTDFAALAPDGQLQRIVGFFRAGS